MSAAKVFALSLALLSATAACSGGDESGDPPADELRAAVQATLDSSSFRLISLPHDPDGNGDPGNVDELPSAAEHFDYVAPDRARQVDTWTEPVGSTPGVYLDTVGIGATTYQELPAKPGFFTIVPIPDGYPLADDVLDTLRGPSSEVGDVDVEQDGETYRLTLPARPSSLGEARVEAIVVEGRLQRLLMRWEDFGEEVLQDCEFSMYGNVPEIEPPPPDRLVPYAQELLGSPGLHACGPDGLPPPGELGCGSIGLPPS